MSTQTSALAVMAGRLQCDTTKLLDTLKATVFKGATNEELMALCVVANAYNLNPFLKQIHAFPAKGGGIVPVVGIDGWCSIIDSRPEMDGMTTTYDIGPNGEPISCTCTIYRKDRSHPTVVTEFVSECRRPTDSWKSMPFRMIRHKAIMQCGRVAFGLSGIYDEDEANDIKAVSGRVVPTATPAKPFTPPAKPALGAQVQGDTEEDHIPFELDASGPTSLDILISRCLNDKLDTDKVAEWLAKNKFPALPMMMNSEAEEVLGLYEELKKEAK